MLNPDSFEIGITSFNRPHLLYKTLESVAKLHDAHSVIIFDDASNEIDYQRVQNIVPRAKFFRGAEPTGRADYAAATLMDIFLKIGKDYLVMVDSDLLVDISLSNFLSKRATETDGLFSLFNTKNHPTIGKKGDWLIKESIGFAGSVIRKDWVRKFRDNVPVSHKYDWDCSKYFVDQGSKILVTERSYFQHIGFTSGQNSGLLNSDYGVNFKGFTAENISDFLDEFIEKQDIINRVFYAEIVRLKGILEKHKLEF